MVSLLHSSFETKITIQNTYIHICDLIIFFAHMSTYAIFVFTLNAHKAIIFQTLISSQDFAKSGIKKLNNLVIWQKVINLSVLEVHKLKSACRIMFFSREDFSFHEKIIK